MYDFAILLLLGLTLLKVVHLLESFVPRLSEFHLPLTVVLAVAGMVLADYSIFERYGVELRTAEIGTWITGLVLAGTASMWRAVFQWLGSSEGDQPEVGHAGRPRIAA